MIGSTKLYGASWCRSFEITGILRSIILVLDRRCGFDWIYITFQLWLHPCSYVFQQWGSST